MSEPAIKQVESDLETSHMGPLQRLRSNPNNIASIIGVLLVAVLCQAAGAESPALQYIANEFSDVPMTTITLISTAPSLLMIPVSLLFVPLYKKLGVRKILLLCIICLTVGGVMPAWAHSVGQIIAWRLVFGIGVGFVWPLSQTLIVEMYSGKKQNTLIGFNSVITGVGGIIWANLGGVLALTSWRYSFYSYFLAFVILLIAFIFVPEPSKIQEKFKIKFDELKEDTKDIAGKIGKLSSTGAVVFVLITMFIYNGTNMTFFTNLAAKIVGEGLGNSASAGLAQSMFTVGSTLLGLLFGLLMANKFLRKYGIGIGWLITGLGFMIFARSEVYSLCLVGALIQGLGTGLYFPSVIGILGNIQGKAKAALWLGVMNCTTGVAQVLFPYLYNYITQTAHQASGSFPMTIAASVHIVCAVVTIVVLLGIARGGKHFEF